MRLQLVSIIMPTFMHGKYIARAIESVRAQVYRDWELIIINDGSSDNTEDIVQKYLFDGRIRYCYQANLGTSSARNAGILVSKGNLLAYLDSDDVLLPNHLSVRLNLIFRLGVDFVFGPIWVVNGDNYNLYHGELSERDSACVMPLMVMHKRHCLNVGNFDPKDVFEEDLNLFLKIRESFKVHQFMSPVTAKYHVYEQSVHKIYEKYGEYGVIDYRKKNRKE